MKKDNKKQLERVYNMSFASVYPLLVAKAEKKGRTKEEVNILIHWLTGYAIDPASEALHHEFDENKADSHLSDAPLSKIKSLQSVISENITYKEFFENAPLLNPDRALITGSICGVKIEEIEDEIMKNVRYLDKLVDDLSKNKKSGLVVNILNSGLVNN